MTPTHWVVLMLVTVSVVYSGAALAYHYSMRPGMAVAFVGYVIANAGLIWDALHSVAK